MKILTLIGATTVAVALATSPALAKKVHRHHEVMQSNAYYPAPYAYYPAPYVYSAQRGPYPGRALNEFHNTYDNGYMYYARRAGQPGYR